LWHTADSKKITLLVVCTDNCYLLIPQENAEVLFPKCLLIFSFKHSDFIQYKQVLFYMISFFYDFGVIWLENLHHFSTLHDNFWFNVIWHRWYTILFNLTWFGIDGPWPYLCWRLAESDVTVIPSVTRMDWLCWWYKHAALAVPLSPSLTLVSK